MKKFGSVIAQTFKQITQRAEFLGLHNERNTWELNTKAQELTGAACGGAFSH